MWFGVDPANNLGSNAHATAAASILRECNAQQEQWNYKLLNTTLDVFLSLCWPCRHIPRSWEIKGTVSRDFRPSVFFINQYPWAP
jgi:hypothetical protein